MRETSKLISRLSADFPEINFKQVSGSVFAWSPRDKQITYPPLRSKEDLMLLLHEAAHARLNHFDYHRDIELINKELLAWLHAQKVLAPRYSITIDQARIDSELETYRHWLYLRSLCPKCGQSGIQQKPYSYLCLNCSTKWRPNNARLCRLKRALLKD